ncbi:regulation of nuclear pre-mRNA domain-containing protein 1B [Tanacetum coccineum]
MDENMDLNMNMNLNNFMEAVENMDLNKQVFEKDNELESDTEDVLQEFANPNAVIEEVTETRKMTEAEKMFVVKAATNKIGATRAHNLLSSMKGGYEYVHGTTDDFKNHQRDVNVFIGESDAQMLINKMENRKTYVPNFTFQYRVENSELVSMFWADEVAKCNYKEFGDIVSFDATFNSNKYNMKFVPFIGIDNHGKCVTLGSGMLLHEDTKSYTWLLTAFMTAFLKEPTMIVTDQDGAMKRAIEAVFTKSKHRLCMWHIMQKIPSKYRVENSELVSMFWADEVAKCNYKEFGDIVSFDATFNSNK